MRRLAILSGLVGLLLTGCNAGQPRIFRVALDTGPVKGLQDPQCFHGNMPNLSTIVQDTSLIAELNWVVWDGADQKQFLDMGTESFSLADAPTIVVDEMIVGGSNTFSGTRVQQDRNGIIELQTTTVTAAFSDLGPTPTGTLDLDAKYQCQDGDSSHKCPSEPNKRSCHTQLNFWARKVDVSQTTAYSNVGSGLTVSTR
jgi:hypothetical protein